MHIRIVLQAALLTLPSTDRADVGKIADLHSCGIFD